MIYLIDTHVLLWYFQGSPENSELANEIMAGSESVVIHMASLWEIAVKVSIGKLDIDVPAMLSRLERDSIGILPFLPDPVVSLSRLPFPMSGRHVHKDPFDRMIAATVLAHPVYRLVSCDAVFDLYGISRVW